MTISAADGEVMADGPLHARPSIRSAWTRSSRPLRAAAVTAAIVGVTMGVLGHVPLPSGLAVTVLVPPALIDVHYQRLPNRWVAAAGVTFGLASLLHVAVGRQIDVRGILLGAAVLTTPMLALHLLSPAAMGFGDVKAGLVLGASLGAIGWELALAGLALAAGTTSVSAIVRNRTVVAFGPGLVAGSLVALAAHTVFVVAPVEPAASATPPVPVEIGGDAGLPATDRPLPDGGTTS